VTCRSTLSNIPPLSTQNHPISYPVIRSHSRSFTFFSPAQVVLVGLPKGDMPLNILDIVMRGITVRGSIVGTREDLAQALDFAARGKASGVPP
jgi:hypothetical protein